MKCRKTGSRTETETIRNTAYAHWLASLACSVTLIIEPRPTFPTRVPPTVDSALPSPLNQQLRNAPQKCPQANPVKAVPQMRFLLSWPVQHCIKLPKKLTIGVNLLNGHLWHLIFLFFFYGPVWSISFFTDLNLHLNSLEHNVKWAEAGLRQPGFVNLSLIGQYWRLCFVLYPLASAFAYSTLNRLYLSQR